MFRMQCHPTPQGPQWHRCYGLFHLGDEETSPREAGWLVLGCRVVQPGGEPCQDVHQVVSTGPGTGDLLSTCYRVIGQGRAVTHCSCSSISGLAVGPSPCLGQSDPAWTSVG